MSEPARNSAQAQAKAIVDILEQVARERSNQIDRGYNPEHDDEHEDGELADAGAAYAVMAAGQAMPDIDYAELQEDAFKLWPWGPEYFKPRSARENLIRAAALLVAEVERIDRRNAVRT